MTLTHISTFWQASQDGLPPCQLVRMEFRNEDGDTTVSYVEASPEVLNAVAYCATYLPGDCN